MIIILLFCIFIQVCFMHFLNSNSIRFKMLQIFRVVQIIDTNCREMQNRQGKNLQLPWPGKAVKPFGRKVYLAA